MQTRTLEQLTRDDILSVYSGRAGKCCCGCAGRHTYHPAHQAEGTRTRGYEVTDEECNARTVALILRKIKKAAGDAEIDYGSNYVAIDVGSRTYIAYPRDGVTVVYQNALPRRDS